MAMGSKSEIVREGDAEKFDSVNLFNARDGSGKVGLTLFPGRQPSRSPIWMSY